ncbi:hypothetical protein DSO57_1028439 [Entomophthora muscae]|uniref:Uncharacterized protein n=1 Tax=Entomophthora muscae TaxID=34485 RepID=A0ACC2TNZ0_9FUNG|nr:hypothetical protein DSO57_1028439 [Entomophthora muscae]
MKLIKLLLVKISKRTITESDINAEGIPDLIDLLVDEAKAVSNSVDDLGASLWDRNNHEELSDAISNLASCTKSLLKLATSISSDSHHSWFESCAKQVASLESDLLVGATGW